MGLALAPPIFANCVRCFALTTVFTLFFVPHLRHAIVFDRTVRLVTVATIDGSVAKRAVLQTLRRNRARPAVNSDVVDERKAFVHVGITLHKSGDTLTCACKAVCAARSPVKSLPLFTTVRVLNLER